MAFLLNFFLYFCDFGANLGREHILRRGASGLRCFWAALRNFCVVAGLGSDVLGLGLDVRGLGFELLGLGFEVLGVFDEAQRIENQCASAPEPPDPGAGLRSFGAGVRASGAGVRSAGAGVRASGAGLPHFVLFSPKPSALSITRLRPNINATHAKQHRNNEAQLGAPGSP